MAASTWAKRRPWSPASSRGCASVWSAWGATPIPSTSNGHRWVIPAAAGTAANANNAIPNPLVNISSQFEDTRIFGPANSFAFTVQEGTSFMRAEPPFGEWHMHCHVLSHMMGGMMGSLLIVNGGELFFGLPSGQPCPPDVNGPDVVNIIDNSFSPVSLAVAQ